MHADQERLERFVRESPWSHENVETELREPAQIARDLDRDYEAVLDFVHEVQDVSGEIDEFNLYDVCEADEVYVTAVRKDVRTRNRVRASADSQKRGAETSNQTNHQS